MLPEKTVTPQTLYYKLLYRLCGVTRKDSNTTDSNTTDFLLQVTRGSVVLPEKTVTPQTLYYKLLYRLCGVTRKDSNTTDSNTTDFISQVTIQALWCYQERQ